MGGTGQKFDDGLCAMRNLEKDSKMVYWGRGGSWEIAASLYVRDGADKITEVEQYMR